MKVSADGILPSDSKVEAIKNWPVPTNVQEVRQFVCLTSHYRRFIRHFLSVAAPLTELTKGTGPKRRSIIWSKECQKVFDQLKFLLTHAPCLQPPDVTKLYIIEADSSDYGCGAILLQKDGQGTVFELMRKRWWWPNMRTNIQDWLPTCKECQLASGSGKSKHRVPMVFLDISPAFGRWHLDFVGEIPLTPHGNK